MEFVKNPDKLIYSVVEFFPEHDQFIETARTFYSWQAEEMAKDIYTRKEKDALKNGELIVVKAINRNFNTVLVEYSTVY